ncbi:MAG: hypothetical protein A3J46_04870 [Candidatus Yanofskybacteria bacterium RIFCSPHIGHO2_02_FULL_41_11]|uniref:DUF3048 domain-containing protein n=1 Tax=Candidatus Yanofskybacteria bacterium RIFCSPHIGHO2_02_FULL_41_11 TaxID=1802675 RepID=A0A1F8FAT1_9BACT|nr:MAG: hypothetical protein A3J46_04870 [Candidatus Yanofskybacteria bacterium RIFCSPHIGHO2_02_FULL_41_11]
MRVNLNFKKLDINNSLTIVGIAAGVFLVVFLFWWRWGQLSWLDGSNIIGIKNEDQRPRASLTGLACENYDKRPIAVMMASDPEARPLSGIGQADLVVEMPVTPNGITRMMAIFQCEEPFDSAQGKPADIGSIRSAREDFLPLAASFGALYAHWGGEREALNELNNGILDNIDAMKYEGTVFYRKNSVPRPHNGFTTTELLEDKAEDLGYELNDTFTGFLREEKKPERNLNNIVSAVSVDYENSYRVEWNHNDESNTYKRIRGGEAEIDKNTGKQVETNIVVLMHTTSKVLNKDYITVNTTGEGEAEFYQNGIKTGGKWKNVANDFRFYDSSGQEMKFILGKMWMHFVTNNQQPTTNNK